MRQLLLVTIVLAGCGPAAARGDTLQTLDAAQVAAQKLDGCFERNYQPSTDRSGDGGRSRRRLLAACDTEWDAAADACQAATGTPMQACRKQTGSLADAYLGLKGAGLQQ